MQTSVNYSKPLPKEDQSNLSDMLHELPADQTMPSHNEIRIVDSLFQQKKGVFDKILENTKDILILGILFSVLSIPQVDTIIKKLITI